MGRRLALLVLTAGLTVAIFTVAAFDGAAAGTGYYTKGDAEAVLGAYPTGGGAISTHAGHVHVGPTRAVPADGLSIRPISPFFSRARYCVLDWHVVALALIDVEFVVHTEEPIVYTREDALTFLSSRVEFLLDGSPFKVSEMPIQPYLVQRYIDAYEAELEAEFKADVTMGDAWATQDGRAVSPSELAVGRHTLSATVFDPVFGPFTDGITFYVDPPGSAACTRS